MKQTLSIIKPDGVKRNLIGAILQKFEHAGLKIKQLKLIQLSKEQAEAFYAVHKERPFYHELVGYMSSGPVVVSVLEGEDAIQKNRQIMGATDPKQAEKGSIRAEFAINIEQNTVHGSDAEDTAKTEIAFFFKHSSAE